MDKNKGEEELTTIKVKKATRRKLNIIAAKKEKSVDDTINYLIDFEYLKVKEKV